MIHTSTHPSNKMDSSLGQEPLSCQEGCAVCSRAGRINPCRHRQSAPSRRPAAGAAQCPRRACARPWTWTPAGPRPGSAGRRRPPSAAPRCQMPAPANVHTLIHLSDAFHSVDQVRCSRHSMEALHAALSWDLLHQSSASSCRCRLAQGLHASSRPREHEAVPGILLAG